MINNGQTYINNNTGQSEPINAYDPVSVYQATRPKDWLQMPNIKEDEIFALFHIPPDSEECISFSVQCDGSYNVEFGTVKNGEFVSKSSESLSCGSQYEKILRAMDFPDSTLDGTKQVMIKISGSAITEFQVQRMSDPTIVGKSLFSNSCWNIVEMACWLPNAVVVHPEYRYKDENPSSTSRLRYFSLVGENKIENFERMFYYCDSLICVLHLNTSMATTMKNMFNQCRSLLAIPHLYTDNVTNMDGMFRGCSVLPGIYDMNTSSVTDMSYMFYECAKLQSIPLIDTSAVTSMYYMFYNCSSLLSIPEINTEGVQYMNYMFYGCTSMMSAPNISTTNVLNATGMFGCWSIYPDLTQFDFKNSAELSGIVCDTACKELLDCIYPFSAPVYFRGSELRIIDNLDVSAVNGQVSFGPTVISIQNLKIGASCSRIYFSDNYVLQDFTFSPDITECSGCTLILPNRFGHTSLIRLFLSLPTVTGDESTIALKVCAGAASLSDEEKAIATSKGWTLVLE